MKLKTRFKNKQLKSFVLQAKKNIKEIGHEDNLENILCEIEMFDSIFRTGLYPEEENKIIELYYEVEESDERDGK